MEIEISTSLSRAQAALSSLGHMACYFDDNGETTNPTTFGYGLSVILAYINSDLTSVYDALNRDKKGEQQ